MASWKIVVAAVLMGVPLLPAQAHAQDSRELSAQWQLDDSGATREAPENADTPEGRPRVAMLATFGAAAGIQLLGAVATVLLVPVAAVAVLVGGLGAGAGGVAGGFLGTLVGGLAGPMAMMVALLLQGALSVAVVGCSTAAGWALAAKVGNRRVPVLPGYAKAWLPSVVVAAVGVVLSAAGMGVGAVVGGVMAGLIHAGVTKTGLSDVALTSEGQVFTQAIAPIVLVWVMVPYVVAGLVGVAGLTLFSVFSKALPPFFLAYHVMNSGRDRAPGEKPLTFDALAVPAPTVNGMDNPQAPVPRKRRQHLPTDVQQEHAEETPVAPTVLPDADADLVLGEEDRCPTMPEDRDGFMDEDGCPDLDNDGDGILDTADACPMQAGPFETRGCMQDQDGDGIPDDRDGCPTLKEDVNRFQDQDGCPEGDSDGDGITDAKDACPNVAGPMTNRGCPMVPAGRTP